MKIFGQKKWRVCAIILAAVLLCVVIGLIIFFIGKEDNPHLIFQGDAGKVELKSTERKSTLCVGVSTSIIDKHPYTHGDEASEVLKKFVYEPLINIDNDLNVTYCNAKSIQFGKEGRQVTVKLNRDKVFSNGEKVNAASVLDSYKWFMANDTAYRNILNRIIDIRAVKEDTLVFTFTAADCDNINIFNIPIIFLPKKGEDYAFGTGAYAIDAIKPYSDIILKENKRSKGSPEYEKVLIKTVDFGNVEKLLKSQTFDIFVFNKKEHADVIKKDKAYDIYELGKDTGWFLKNNQDSEEIGRAVADVTEGEAFFKKTKADGIYSPGVVNAYITPNYYSMKKGGNFQGKKTLTIMHDSVETALGIYHALEKKLSDKDIKCVEKSAGFEEVPEEFEEDLLIYYGSFKDGMSWADNQTFFKEHKTIDVLNYYDLLEKYFVSKNSIIPISKDTYWVASLAERNTMGLTD